MWNYQSSDGGGVAACRQRIKTLIVYRPLEGTVGCSGYKDRFFADCGFALTDFHNSKTVLSV